MSKIFINSFWTCSKLKPINVFKLRLNVLHFGKFFIIRLLQFSISDCGFVERSILFNNTK